MSHETSAPVATAAARNGLATIGEGRSRVIIERVSPQLDGGRFAVKRISGDMLVVEADIYADGHDALSAALHLRAVGESTSSEAPMLPLVNDRWGGELPVGAAGRYEYSVLAWVDRFKSWARDLAKRAEAGQDLAVDLQIGALLVEEAAAHAPQDDAIRLRASAAALRAADEMALGQALSGDLAGLMAAYLPRRYASRSPWLRLNVDRAKARFSTWYELFPRSTSPERGRHGTLRDVINRLPYVAEMGFDVLYLPPIHPIGVAHRKGKNNSVTASPGEPGSPWAIGAAEGGHKSILPELGTFEDFAALVAAAEHHGIEIALDIAFQCAPDHPYVKQHPQWFRARPDGTIQYAENPPKKYQDIYPFDFETPDWENLWYELKSIFEFWIERGVKVFRVDNPHTKSLRFWEWCMAEIKAAHPEVMFLSEAFTRPKVMYNLAKVGFTQSYTYFAWRQQRWELIEYLTELTQGEPKEFFRPNFWPNTPDILTEQFWGGERSIFLHRVVLAATLTANYGLYGPAYELLEHMPLTRGKEEYLNSEKYEVRHWNLDDPKSISGFIGQLNRIRRDNPALQRNDTLQFHNVDLDFRPNENLIAYSKRSTDGSNIVLTVVNLDPNQTQSGWVELPIDEFGIGEDETYQVHDVIADARYFWRGRHNYVSLNPLIMPAHIFVIRRKTRDANNFEYFR